MYKNTLVADQDELAHNPTTFFSYSLGWTINESELTEKQKIGFLAKLNIYLGYETKKKT